MNAKKLFGQSGALRRIDNESPAIADVRHKFLNPLGRPRYSPTHDDSVVRVEWRRRWTRGRGDGGTRRCRIVRGNDHVKDIAERTGDEWLTISHRRFAFQHKPRIVSDAKQLSQSSIRSVYLCNLNWPMRIVGPLEPMSWIDA